MTIKTTTDRTACVDTDIHWIDATQHRPPSGAKVLCINQRHGIAVLSTWLPSHGFTHWHPLPTWKKP